MKRQLLLTMTLLTLGLTTTKAQNPQMGDYGYLYCHMHGNGRAWTAYALSRAHTGTVPLCAKGKIKSAPLIKDFLPVK